MERATRLELVERAKSIVGIPCQAENHARGAQSGLKHALLIQEYGDEGKRAGYHQVHERYGLGMNGTIGE